MAEERYKEDLETFAKLYPEYKDFIDNAINQAAESGSHIGTIEFDGVDGDKFRIADLMRDKGYIEES